jgi:hypothetical protein
MLRKTNTQRLLHKLFNAIAHAVDDIGYANTIQVLNNSRTKHATHYDDFNLCVMAVTQVFNMAKSELLQGTQKKYPRKYAFGILIYLAVTEYDYTLADLGRHLERDRSNLSRTKKEIGQQFESGDSKFDEMIYAKYLSCKQVLHKLQNRTETHD